MGIGEIQRLFWRAITWPTGVEDFLAQADPDTRHAFEATFASTPTFDARARVNVYAESYYWRLEQVLRDQYRVCAWICGDVRFHDLCTDFVLERPSRDGDVRRVGAPFSEYVAGHPIAREIEGIEDVARIERSAVEAIDAPDLPRWSPQDLARVPLPDWPGLRLRALPGVALHRCRLPYAALWKARERGEPSPDAMGRPADGPAQAVLVWRSGLEVFHRTVEPSEAAALQALIGATSFAELCAAAQHTATAPGQPAVQPVTVVQWLRRWLDDGLVAAP